jgi:4a-hydroxytetrahydrobiopterin dehydratase
MLASYLRQMRQRSVLSTSQALSQLGSGWTESDDGALSKSFEFEDYKMASNFIARYTDYCQKVNQVPEWSNVYNKVSVRLLNAEFSAVTTKEVQVGKYLDMVSEQTINKDVEDFLRLEQVVEAAKIDRPSLLNAQDEPTSLFLDDMQKTKREQLYLQ